MDASKPVKAIKAFDALLLVEECWRHAKAIGARGPGVTALEQSGVAGTPGFVTGDTAADVFATIATDGRTPGMGPVPRLGHLTRGAADKWLSSATDED